MTRHRSLLLLMPVPAGLVLTAGSRAEKPMDEKAVAIPIAMEDCKASRPDRITSAAGILRFLTSGPPREELVKRGAVQVDGQKYTLYLPRAKSYSIKNTKPS